MQKKCTKGKSKQSRVGSKFHGTEHARKRVAQAPNRAQSLLGRGTYGYVHKVTVDGESRALKYFVYRKNEMFLNNIHELDMMYKCRDHPGVARIEHVSLDSPASYVPDVVYKKNSLGCLSIIMKCYDCDLLGYIHDRWTLQPLCRISFKLLNALSYLHSKGIIHRDLKPTNVLMSGQDPCIGDFGLARQYNGLDDLSCSVSHLNYRAPEMIAGKKYDYKVDVWATGAILYHLYSRKPLFEVPSHIKGPDHLSFQASCVPVHWIMPMFMSTAARKKMHVADKPAHHKKLTAKMLKMNRRNRDLLEHLLEGMLNFNPMYRMSSRSTIEHEFFSNRSMRCYESHSNNTSRPRVSKKLSSQKVSVPARDGTKYPSWRCTDEVTCGTASSAAAGHCVCGIKRPAPDNISSRSKKAALSLGVHHSVTGCQDLPDRTNPRESPACVTSGNLNSCQVSGILRDMGVHSSFNAEATSPKQSTDNGGECSCLYVPACSDKLDDTILVHQCRERQWALKIVFDYFNYKIKHDPKWLQFSTIFMAVDLIDKYLYACHHASHADIGTVSSNEPGDEKGCDVSHTAKRQHPQQLPIGASTHQADYRQLVNSSCDLKVPTELDKVDKVDEAGRESVACSDVKSVSDRRQCSSDRDRDTDGGTESMCCHPVQTDVDVALKDGGWRNRSESTGYKPLLTLNRALQVALVCMYISTKYNIGFAEFPTLETFNITGTDLPRSEWWSLEKDIVIHCMDCMPHSPTLLDVACDRGMELTHGDVENLLTIMQLESVKCGTMKSDLLETYVRKLKQDSTSV